MLGALPVVAVGQQHDQAALSEPLVLASDDELVDHDLRPIHEIPELGLPDDEAVGVLEAVPVLETQQGELREDGVAADESGLRVGGGQLLLRGRHVEVLGQKIEGSVLLLGHLILHHRVAVAEGAALHVLSRDADVVALEKEGTDCHGLGRTPVDSGPLLRHVLPGLEDLRHLPVQLEVVGHRACRHANFAEPVRIHPGGADTAVLLGALEASPAGAQPVLGLALVRLALLEVGLVAVEGEVPHLLKLLLRGRPVVDEVLLVDVEG